MKKLLLTTALCLAFPLAAHAAPLSYNWSGPYLGLSAGVGSITTKTTAGPGAYYDSAGQLGSSGGGILAGVTAGYNYEFANAMVTGIEGDYSLATIGNSGGANSGNIIGQGTKMDSFSTVRVRLGYALGDNLIYATGGLAFASVESHSVFGLLSYPGYYNEVSKTQEGWTAGAGIEHALSNNLTFKAEAMYAGLGTENATNGAGLTMSFKNNVAIVRAGVNYKF